VNVTRWHRNPAATLAAIWAALFCAAHLYWAAGGTQGLPADVTMSDRPALFALDLIAIPACLLGVLIAQRLGDGDYRATPFVLGSAGASLMLWHAALNYLFLGVRELNGQPFTEHDRFYSMLYEPFWLIGGVLWLLAAIRYRRLRVPANVPVSAPISRIRGGVAVDLGKQSCLDLIGRK
jgi:hypothetical protein